LSTVCPNGTDMRTMAGALIDTVVQIYGKNKTVVLAGHDRGARSMQRAAVDIGQGGFTQIRAAGVWLADIVPIIIEYGSFSNPNNSVGYFHWVSDIQEAANNRADCKTELPSKSTRWILFASDHGLWRR
jgi:haloacetate dehalogenase